MAPALVLGTAEDELELIVRTLVDEFERAVFGATSQWRRSARLLAIILFGAHAVDTPVTAGPGGEMPDRQILVVVSDERLTDFHRYWSGADERFQRAHTILGSLSVPVNLLVRPVKYVNHYLERGTPFFSNIVDGGVRLYEAPSCPFSKSRKLGTDAARPEACAAFEEWMGAAERRLKMFVIEEAEGRQNTIWRRDAAFTLHQAVERLYGCILLTREGYSPPTHQIGALRSLAEQVETTLFEAWPRETKDERRAFELLRQAYIRGRYARDFRITEQQLAWLADRAEVLRRLVRKACEETLLPADRRIEPALGIGANPPSRASKATRGG